MNLVDQNIDNRWSLFLDRDGVINKKVDCGYVMSKEQFVFLPGVLEALTILTRTFGSIFIVTNQQCVGKNLISTADLDEIHEYMLSEISARGGLIKDIFVSPHLESEKSPFRKPGLGMIHSAINKYPDIDLSKSLMAGDSMTDMKFGRDAGMITILIGHVPEDTRSVIDYNYGSLIQFAQVLKEKI